MLKKIAHIGIFTMVSLVSLSPRASEARPSTRVDSTLTKGHPDMKGMCYLFMHC